MRVEYYICATCNGSGISLYDGMTGKEEECPDCEGYGYVEK